MSFAVEPGDFVGLIGPNGAGKTTLIRIVAGSCRPDRGRVALGGVDVTGDATAARVRRGLALTHQIVRPFREMTVLDNVVLGRRLSPHVKSVPRHAAASIGAARASVPPLFSAASVSAGTERKLAGSLPLGQMKRLEVARALAVDPERHSARRAAGRASTIPKRRGRRRPSRRCTQRGVTVVLVEHNLEEVMRVSPAPGRAQQRAG